MLRSGRWRRLLSRCFIASYGATGGAKCGTAVSKISQHRGRVRIGPGTLYTILAASSCGLIVETETEVA